MDLQGNLISRARARLRKASLRAKILVAIGLGLLSPATFAWVKVSFAWLQIACALDVGQQHSARCAVIHQVETVLQPVADDRRR